MEQMIPYLNYCKNNSLSGFPYGLNIVSEPERKQYKIKVVLKYHEGRNKLFIEIPDNLENIGKILTLKGVDWCENFQSWFADHSAKNIYLLFSLFKGIAWIDISSIPDPYLLNLSQKSQNINVAVKTSELNISDEKLNKSIDHIEELSWTNIGKEVLSEGKFILDEFIPSSTKSWLSDQDELVWYEKNIIAKTRKPEVIKEEMNKNSHGIILSENSERLVFLSNSIKEEVVVELECFKSWMRQLRYSENTINTYYDCLTVFFRFFNNMHFTEITNDDLIFFNDKYIISNKLSSSYQNQIISAIRMFFLKKCNIELDISTIERPRRYRRLPKVIPKQDVERMLKGMKNFKHKMALTLVYACGLRRNELLNLKCENVCFKRKTLTILNAKGQKDRVLPLSDKLIILINTYYDLYKPLLYFIEGASSGMMYSATSLLEIFHKQMDEVIPENRFTLHCLRHSFATHLLESGTDLRYIQTLLGHKSSKTTEIYTWVSMKSLHNIKNPTDDFDL